MTTLNIRIRALEHNIEIIRSLAADAQIIAVLKGNAYGLGKITPNEKGERKCILKI